MRSTRRQAGWWKRRRTNSILAEPDAEEEVDDYAWQCAYAGCYPWLDSATRAQLHDDMPDTADADQPG